MAKKKHKKKHNFKYSAPSSVTATPTSSPARSSKSEATNTTAVVSNKSNTAMAEDFSYVRRDLTKVGVLTASFTALQLVLWYVFNNSSLGPQIYRLIKL